jgi:hypothetical protein
MKFVDNAIATRILYLLNLPFQQWPAYRQGIIDHDGKIVKQKESDDWTMLHRLVARLKMLLAKIPGGNSHLGTMLASYLLVKENIENDGEHLTESDIILKRPTFREYVEYNDFISLEEAQGRAINWTHPAAAGHANNPNNRQTNTRINPQAPRHINPQQNRRSSQSRRRSRNRSTAAMLAVDALANTAQKLDDKAVVIPGALKAISGAIKLKKITEDGEAPTNVAGNIAIADAPIGEKSLRKNKTKIMRRKYVDINSTQVS